ncbi:MAG: hypothetical protein A2X42_08310 [Candidatus Margulisbacteria bacterium GWF2_38_17]|nr:MAG: hypothetical protein A2X42_08310 [Candidatus Margulisbacteria bacterium GWF2_38_17]
MESIYIHFPFCVKKCGYCSFYSLENQQDLMEEYSFALKREIKALSQQFSRNTIKTIYLGGGTPSLISAKLLERILLCLKENFRLSNPEITIEVNPGTVDYSKIKHFFEVGINRVSIGVQSFLDSELSLLGRIHSRNEAIRTVTDCAAAGFSNINIDLIFALPNQTKDQLSQSLCVVKDLPVDHISTYNLHLDPGTPMYEALNHNCFTLPDEEIDAEFYEYIIDTLPKLGLQHYEISNFARPGKECRHNLAYWDYYDFLGIGAGATSMIAGARYTNTEDINDYLSVSPLHQKEEEILDEYTQIAEAIFMGLRKRKGIFLNDLSSRFGVNIMQHYEKVISELVNKKLVITDADVLCLSDNGLLLANEVFEAFLP